MIVNRSVPPAPVIPVLAYDDVAEATDWLCNAFGFTERLRIGAHRVQLVFGDGAVVVTAIDRRRRSRLLGRHRDRPRRPALGGEPQRKLDGRLDCAKSGVARTSVPPDLLGAVGREQIESDGTHGGDGRELDEPFGVRVWKARHPR